MKAQSVSFVDEYAVAIVESDKKEHVTIDFLKKWFIDGGILGK